MSRKSVENKCFNSATCTSLSCDKGMYINLKPSSISKTKKHVQYNIYCFCLFIYSCPKWSHVQDSLQGTNCQNGFKKGEGPAGQEEEKKVMSLSSQQSKSQPFHCTPWDLMSGKNRYGSQRQETNDCLIRFKLCHELCVNLGLNYTFASQRLEKKLLEKLHTQKPGK